MSKMAVPVVSEPVPAVVGTEKGRQSCYNMGEISLRTGNER